MAIKKIPCGGWLYDDEQITFEDGVMKVIGGGSGGGHNNFYAFTISLEGEESSDAVLENSTFSEIISHLWNKDAVYAYLHHQAEDDDVIVMDDVGSSSIQALIHEENDESDLIVIMFPHLTGTIAYQISPDNSVTLIPPDDEDEDE